MFNHKWIDLVIQHMMDVAKPKLWSFGGLSYYGNPEQTQSFSIAWRPTDHNDMGFDEKKKIYFKK